MYLQNESSPLETLPAPSGSRYIRLKTVPVSTIKVALREKCGTSPRRVLLLPNRRCTQGLKRVVYFDNLRVIELLPIWSGKLRPPNHRFNLRR